jgi:hypothetical protein
VNSKYTLILVAIVVYVVWRQSRMAAAVASSTGSTPAGAPVHNDHVLGTFI